MNPHIFTIIEIFVACLMVELLFRWIDKRVNRKLDIGCDYCEEPKKIYRTPDKRFYLCKGCMDAYLDENGFSDEDKIKVKNRYKINRKKKVTK